MVSLVFVYGFIGWTAWISLTRSRLLPRYDFHGFIQYERLFESVRWDAAINNLFIFGFLFIVISTILGLILAILLDQKIRTEGVIRTIYLYPMALSLIVTGTAWKWILNPGLGFEAAIQGLGWTDFSFNWLVDPEMAIYTVVIAGVWQASGFVMALFGRFAIDRSGSDQGRAGRWHTYLADLCIDHHPVDGIGLSFSVYRSGAFGDQEF